MSKEEIIRQVQMLAQESGKTPTRLEFDLDPRVASSNTVIVHFGSWNNCVVAAGLEPNHPVDLSDDELIEQVLKLARDSGKTPTVKEFERSPHTASVFTIYKHFGSWGKYLEKAGLR